MKPALMRNHRVLHGVVPVVGIRGEDGAGKLETGEPQDEVVLHGAEVLRSRIGSVELGDLEEVAVRHCQEEHAEKKEELLRHSLLRNGEGREVRHPHAS